MIARNLAGRDFARNSPGVNHPPRELGFEFVIRCEFGRLERCADRSGGRYPLGEYLVDKDSQPVTLRVPPMVHPTLHLLAAFAFGLTALGDGVVPRPPAQPATPEPTIRAVHGRTVDIA